MQWYYEKSGEQTGPVSEEEFDSLVKSGAILSTTLVWNSTMTDWTEYGRLNAAPDGGSTENSICAECGGYFAKDDMLKYGEAWVCARCKPVFIQKIKEGVKTFSSLDYAGFWIRVGASVIDYIIRLVVSIMISAPFIFLTAGFSSSDNPAGSIIFILLSYLLNFIFDVSYATFFIGKWGATPGKMACGIKVVNPEGEQITYLRAFARYFAKWISQMILGIGYLLVVFDDEKRGLHDMICSTRVVKK